MEKFDRSALKAMRETAERYHENLSAYQEVIQYLSGRGITPELQSEYLLGVCDDVRPGWLSIPYLRPAGAGVVWFNYRRMDDGKPKYQAPGERHLYNTAVMDNADTSGEIAITEGELDAIIATVCGVPAVGVPGATQWTGNPKFRELFVGYQRVWVLADPDEAGLKFAAGVLEVLPKARLVHLPGDVTDTYLKHGELRSFIG